MKTRHKLIEDAPESHFDLGWVELVAIALTIAALLYFAGTALYNVGYVNGYQGKKCGRAECMSEIIKNCR